MCKHGTDRFVDQALLPGVDYIDKTKMVHIDECIADLVLALNKGGVHTVACCCGHEHPPGEIILADGRCLLIVEPDQTIMSIKMLPTEEIGNGQA